MDPSDYLLSVETKKSFDDAVISVLKAVDKKGWNVFQIYDLKERMAAQGFAQKPLKVIEICSVKHAKKILNKNRKASICMPCRINIIDDSDTILIVAMRPSMMPAFFHGISHEDIIDVEKDIVDMITDARL